MQPNPCCAKAAESRVSLDVCRASRKRPEGGYQGSEPHQACRGRLMLLPAISHPVNILLLGEGRVFFDKTCHHPKIADAYTHKLPFLY